ncbi:uncharacterized protein [Ptychodera flava]|uniref:uncharacterized protein n=1 Tax=Ptychodera flava TaxID=63121 RepID=UPI00396A55D0
MLGVFSHIVSSYRSYRRHDHHHEKPPYWLLEGVTVPDKVKKTAHGSASQGDKPAEEDDNDIESPVEGLRTEFDKVQSKMTRDVLTDLERMERERCKTFIQKFMALKLSPLFEKELRAMRSATAQHANGQEMDFDVKPSKWYIDLKTDCHHVVGNHDCDINDILKKLYKFSFEDAKSIPSGKERLCLIVMSLPADELMTIHMQMALYFVLENILNAPPEFFSNWLAHRKIPIVILHT